MNEKSFHQVLREYMERTHKTPHDPVTFHDLIAIDEAEERAAAEPQADGAQG